MGKTILSANTNIPYDGANPIRELNGSTVTSNLLTGGVDERFVRTDSGGTSNYLADALGSTVALTDPSGNSQAQYSYAPYGSISITGTTNNSYTYTGRESDGLGINYYRARYYNPQIGRFISEDPIGFVGGMNKYAYVANDPTDLNDPSGRLPFGAVVGAINGAVFGGLGAMEGDDWDWQDVVGGAVLGAGTGFGLGLLDPTEGALSSAPISAGADWAGQAFHRWRHGQNMSARCYNWGAVAGAGVGGGLGGGLGVYLEGLGAAAGLVEGTEGYGALTFAENTLGGNIGLVTTPSGGAVGDAMSGHKCGCQ
jgi:RHS repeat-associated protein